jgi:hypothetical protein
MELAFATTHMTVSSASSVFRYILVSTVLRASARSRVCVWMGAVGMGAVVACWDGTANFVTAVLSISSHPSVLHALCASLASATMGSQDLEIVSVRPGTRVLCATTVRKASTATLATAWLVFRAHARLIADVNPTDRVFVTSDLRAPCVSSVAQATTLQTAYRASAKLEPVPTVRCLYRVSFVLHIMPPVFCSTDTPFCFECCRNFW